MPHRTHSIPDLRDIAWFQKVLILCLLIQLLLWVGYMLLGLADWDIWENVREVGGLSVLIGIFSGIFVLIQGLKLFNPVLAVLLGLMTMIPCIGLVMVLITNSQATSLLQRNGLRVGLFGARMRDIANLSDDLDGDDEETKRHRKPRRPRDAINEDEGW